MIRLVQMIHFFDMRALFRRLQVQHSRFGKVMYLVYLADLVYSIFSQTTQCQSSALSAVEPLHDDPTLSDFLSVRIPGSEHEYKEVG